MEAITEVSGYEWTGWDFGREPAEHAPQERVLRGGAASLTDQELLIALLGIDVESARHLLELHGGQLLRLFSGGPWASSSLSPLHRTRFLAAQELACRLAAERIPQNDPLCRPDDVCRYLALRYSVRDQEILGALFLNNSGALLRDSEIYRGALNSIRVEPREILKQALLLGAAAVLVFHTHPGGDPAPSNDDMAFTLNLANAAQILGIRLVDHLILGAGGNWTTLRDYMAW